MQAALPWPRQMIDLPNCDLILLIDPVLVCLFAGPHTCSSVVDVVDVVQEHFHQMISGAHTRSIHSESVFKYGEHLKSRTGRHIRSHGCSWPQPGHCCSVWILPQPLKPKRLAMS